MAFVKKPTDSTDTTTDPISRVRITLSSRCPAAIEKVSSDILSKANTSSVKVKGPRRLPTSTLRHTTRKTPCGNGTNTWDTYEMKIYKRVVDLFANRETVRHVTGIEIAPGVDVEVTIN
eukprot:Tbor_TRINITY_DN5629_c4_g1::TRINITY_DN5629_c4_g1_i1::g.8593::m.8593/K02969/RP-S20e, RPS20; small subunit ribosomal protein S20e